MTKKGVTLVIIMTFFVTLKAGWSYHAHLNYLKEAVCILDYFDYEMCLSYKDDLAKGFIEGEIQYKYRAKDKTPAWLKSLSIEEINYMQGHTIVKKDISKASNFFYQKFLELKTDIVEMRRPYSVVMFELGYFLHSINNILLPEYEKGHFPEQPLASNTSNLALDSKEIEVIDDAPTWFTSMISRKIEIRDIC